MFSNKTLLELIRLTDQMEHPEINRIISVFGVFRSNSTKQTTVTSKGTDLYHHFRTTTQPGPFSSSSQTDFLQYLIDDFFRRKPSFENGTVAYSPLTKISVKFENAFQQYHYNLANSLRRDGYVVVGREIRKLLPSEIVEAKIESDLLISLKRFRFSISEGHLNQAINAHTQGNWAAANSQFRTFIESLFVEISILLLPNNEPPATAAKAIKLLGGTVNPPFFREDLNEVTNDKEKDVFVNGFWSRLHPDGSHPGLSDEEDSSFRYHLTIVFAGYLMRRLINRQPPI